MTTFEIPDSPSAFETPNSLSFGSKKAGPKENISNIVDSEVIGESISNDNADAMNQWFMQDLLVHLTGNECKMGIVTKVDGAMLTVTFVGGGVQNFTQEDLACRVARANALTAQDEAGLDAIIAAIMQRDNTASTHAYEPSSTDSDTSETPPTAQTHAHTFRPRRNRADSSARNLDVKTTFEGLFRSEAGTDDFI